MSKSLKIIALSAALVAIVVLVYSFTADRQTPGPAVSGEGAAAPAASKTPRGGMELQEQYGFAPIGE